MHDAQQFLEQERFNSLRIEIGQIIIRMDKKFIIQIDAIYFCTFSEKLLFKCGIYELLQNEYLHKSNQSFNINQLIELNKKAYNG